MYNTQEIANRIKIQAKSKKTAMKELLFSCELNINAVSEFAKGKQLSCISLAKIADYLDCSVDYLLGRTNNPNNHTSISNTFGPITNNGVVRGSNSSSDVIVNNNNNHHSHELSNQAVELLRIFENLSVRGQTELLSTAFKLEAQNLKK